MVRCISGVAKLLNVDRSNMKKAMERHLQLDTKKGHYLDWSKASKKV